MIHMIIYKKTKCRNANFLTLQKDLKIVIIFIIIIYIYIYIYLLSARFNYIDK